MCSHDHGQTSVPRRSLPRRGVLAAASELAGASEFPVVLDTSASGHLDGGTRGRPNIPPALVVEGATLINPSTGDAVPDAVVVFDGGAVTAAGTRDATSAAVAEVAGRARHLDAAGRWIVPGLIDVHVHTTTLADAQLVLAGGATSARSGSTSFYQDIALAALPDWLPGTSPRMRAAGLFVSPHLGDSALADPDIAPLVGLQNGVTDPSDLAYLTRINLERGANVIKTRANPRAGLADEDPLELAYGREQIAAIVAGARGANVLCHAYSAEGIDAAVRAGVKSVEHGVFVTEATIHEMARLGTYFTPTLHAIMSMSTEPDPVLAQRGHEYAPVLRAAVRAAHEAGVPIVAGTDSFGSDVTPIGAEVRLLGEAGLSPLEALRAATTRAAALLGWDGKAGVLARGAFADAVVVDADPLADAGALEHVRLVVAQGVVVRNEL